MPCHYARLGGSAVADDVCQRVSVNTPSVQHLLLVFHGGQPLDVDHDLHTQQFNVNLFKSGIDSVAEVSLTCLFEL